MFVCFSEPYWAGWSDQEEEGVFVGLASGRLMDGSVHQPWGPGEPNGDRIENCVEATEGKRERMAINDLNCAQRRWSFCNFDEIPHFTLRGLCPASKFDNAYTWRDSLDQQEGEYFYAFNGFTDTRLRHANGTWRMELLSDPGERAELRLGEYPFGTHAWEVTGNVCGDEAGGESGQTLMLNFNACNASEYNCVDGTCVDMASRCDGRVDCPDRSDERHCRVVVPDEAYLKDAAPPPSNNGRRGAAAATDRNNATEVGVHLDLFSILGVNEVDSVISLQFKLMLSWLDPRLTFSNLKGPDRTDVLYPEERETIWVPELTFDNTAGKDATLMDDKTVVAVERSETVPPTPGHVRELHNSHYYEGKDSALRVTRVYAKDVICRCDRNRPPQKINFYVKQFRLIPRVLTYFFGFFAKV